MNRVHVDCTRHRLNSQQAARVASALQEARGYPGPISDFPAAPVDAQGRPVDDFDSLESFVVEMEHASVLAKRCATASQRMTEVRDLVRRACQADPAGRGAVLPGALASALAALPYRDQKDANGRPMFPTLSAFCEAYVPAAEAAADRLSALVRQGFTG